MHVRLWPIDLPIAERFAEVYHQMQSAGRSLSQVDLMLAATTLQLDAKVLTTDKDFGAVTGVVSENWLSSDL